MQRFHRQKCKIVARCQLLVRSTELHTRVRFVHRGKTAPLLIRAEWAVEERLNHRFVNGIRLGGDTRSKSISLDDKHYLYFGCRCTLDPDALEENVDVMQAYAKLIDQLSAMQHVVYVHYRNERGSKKKKRLN